MTLLRPATDVDLDRVVALLLRRCPHLSRALVEAPVLDPATEERVLLLADGPRGPAGVGLQFHPTGLPAGLRWRIVVVDEPDLGTGLGGQLHRALENASAEVTAAAAEVLDIDAHALAVAARWGYRRTQQSVTVGRSLVGVDTPTLPSGVTAEISPGLDFADEAAVEAMHDASQTNPEREHHGPATLATLRGYAAGGVTPVGVLLRDADRRPVAISYAVVAGAEAQVVYTGVDPGSRGRGLAGLAKQVLHAEAARVGATTALTDNEEGNAGIRRVNELLGYQRVTGRVWLRKDYSADS
jgi:GNAT superfamily N-acetyltransferase